MYNYSRIAYVLVKGWFLISEVLLGIAFYTLSFFPTHALSS